MKKKKKKKQRRCKKKGLLTGGEEGGTQQEGNWPKKVPVLKSPLINHYVHVYSEAVCVACCNFSFILTKGCDSHTVWGDGVVGVWAPNLALRMEFSDEFSLSGCSREQEKSVGGGKMTHQLNELREKWELSHRSSRNLQNLIKCCEIPQKMEWEFQAILSGLWREEDPGWQCDTLRISGRSTLYPFSWIPTVFLSFKILTFFGLIR